MATKSRLERLKGNVKTQETKLEKGMRSLQAKKKKTKAPTGYEYYSTEWDALEKTIRTMDELLTSYRRYTLELERVNKKMSTQAKVTKKK